MNGLPKVMHLEVETQNSRYRMQFCQATMGIAVFDAEGAVKVIGRAFGVPWEGYSLKVFPLDGSMPMTFSALKSV